MYFKCFYTGAVLGVMLLGGAMMANPVYAETPVAADTSAQSARVSFKKQPQIDFENADLEGQARHAVIRLDIDKQGKVSSAKVIESTGLPALDAKLVKGYMKARFTPYIENGEGIPVYTIMQLQFDLSR